MDKLTKQQLSGISKLVHLIHDENVLDEKRIYKS